MFHDDRRGIEEAYTAAGNSSNLRVEADQMGDGDWMIAAGWSPSRLGMALMRLHSEWDKAEKPRKPTAAAIAALASGLPAHVFADGNRGAVLTKSQRHEAARKQAHAWYMAQMAALVGKLKSLPSVRAQLVECVSGWGVVDASVKVPMVMAYWLDQTCHGCNGLKFLSVPGAQSLSTKVCKVCRGTGVAPFKDGDEGRRIANYMDDCVSIARSSLKKRLHGRMPAR